MAESQTVVILRAKRDAIAAAILNYERQLDQAKIDFAHVTAALTIFEAENEPGSERAYVSLYRYFKYGEVAAMCRDALKGGPLTTTELAKHVAEAKGLDCADKVFVRSVGFTVLQSLRGMARRNAVDCSRRGNRCLWQLIGA